jgi:hypothetical protein
MSLTNRSAIVFLLVLLSHQHVAQATVTVRFEPSDLAVDVSDAFTLDIVADIPDPVLGWGLDLALDPTIASLVGVDAIGPLWTPAFAPDGDGLAAIAFPSSISGNDVLLATLSFSALALGETDLLLSVTPGDLNEGFPLDPTGFADLIFESGHVTVPEPAALLLAAGMLTVMQRRRR